MGTSNKGLEIRPSVDRPIRPLGFQPRPLLSHATAAIMNHSNTSENGQEEQKSSSVPRREDSTEELPVPPLATPSSLISRLIPNREPALKSSQLWDRVLLHLGQEDMSRAKKYLLRLLRHRSKSTSATFNRCRAVSMVSVLSVVNEWYSIGALSATAGRRLSEGVMLKSKDCIALGAWMYIKSRWALPRGLSPEEMGRYLEHAAVSGHAASQAVLGSILCQSVEEDSSDSSDSQPVNRVNGDVWEGYTMDTCGSSSRTSKRRVAKRCRMLKPQPDKCTGSKWLGEAALQGCVLAVNNILQTVTHGQNYEKLQKKGLKETPGKLYMWPAELAMEPASSEEIFARIQIAANQQIAECVFLTSKLLRRGIGCQKSDAHSLSWVVMVSEMNVPEAFVALRSRAVRSNWRLVDVLASDVSQEERRTHDFSIPEKAKSKCFRTKILFACAMKKYRNGRNMLARMRR